MSAGARFRLPTGHLVLVDRDDLEMLSHWAWSLDGRGYVQASITAGSRKTTVRLHRLLVLPDPNVEVDHINGDRLDNRRSNLRPCSHAGNQRNRTRQSNNRSGYKGVCWHGQHRKWHAQLNYHGRTLHLGYFDRPSEAAHAYDQRARELHGDFARLNFASEVTS